MKKNGFTLVEVMLAIAVLAVAITAMVESMISSGKSEMVLRDKRVVRDSISNVVNSMRATNFATLTTYPTTFDITNINPQAGQAHVGTITFFTDETGAGMTVEDKTSLGFPRDLNANGNMTDTNVTANYVILPAKIEVKWTLGESGDTNSYASYTQYCVFSTQTQ